jgi:hypothetical protein
MAQAQEMRCGEKCSVFIIFCQQNDPFVRSFRSQKHHRDAVSEKTLQNAMRFGLAWLEGSDQPGYSMFSEQLKIAKRLLLVIVRIAKE